MQWAEDLGVEAETAEDIIEEDNPEIKAFIMGAIQKVNRKAVSNAAKVIIDVVIDVMSYVLCSDPQVHYCRGRLQPGWGRAHSDYEGQTSFCPGEISEENPADV